MDQDQVYLDYISYDPKRYIQCDFDWVFAAHHEAGHAVVAEALGANITSAGLLPTPHCIPDVTQLSSHEIAAVCVAGQEATVLHYGHNGGSGAVRTDFDAAMLYTDEIGKASRLAARLIRKNSQRLQEIVKEMLAPIPESCRHDFARICVDTVCDVNANGPDLSKLKFQSPRREA